MKQLSVISLLILLVLACSDKSTSPSPTGLEGDWVGQLTAVYPGADDAMLTVTEIISFVFDTDDFIYYWHGTASGPTPVSKLNEDITPYGVGKYRISNGILSFFDVEYGGSYYPILIDGDYVLSLEDSSLSLSQTIGATWPTTRDIELEKEDSDVRIQ